MKQFFSLSLPIELGKSFVFMHDISDKEALAVYCTINFKEHNLADGKFWFLLISYS